MKNGPGLLLLLLAMPVAACSEEDQNNASFGRYYMCAAGEIDAAYAAGGIADRPAAEAAIEKALETCAGDRDRAFQAFLSEARNDPKVKDYIAKNGLNEADTVKLAEEEFERSIRNQLMENISELHRGASKPSKVGMEGAKT